MLIGNTYTDKNLCSMNNNKNPTWIKIDSYLVKTLFIWVKTNFMIFMWQ